MQIGPILKPRIIEEPGSSDVIVNPDFVFEVGNIRTEISNLWPRSDLFMADAYYWKPRLSHLHQAMADDLTDREKYREQSNDCDDFALHTHSRIKARVKNLIFKRGDGSYYGCTIPFGEVWGMKFRGREMHHAINICVCREGVMLIEPQTDEIWVASGIEDSIYYGRV